MVGFLWYFVGNGGWFVFFGFGFFEGGFIVGGGNLEMVFEDGWSGFVVVDGNEVSGLG